jgi:PAS domain S-box-containing protein
MIPAPLPSDETDRLQSLRALGLLDTAPEERFDRVTRLAQTLFGVPIALITLVDARRQWFKSRQGLNQAAETPREISMCAHAILGSEIMEVPDALLDERFKDNPLVAGGPRVRFYAGCPIAAPDGRRVGTLCIVDMSPRRLTAAEKTALKDLAVLVENEIASGTLGRALARSLAFERKFQRKRRARARSSTVWKVAAGFGAAAAATALLALMSYRTAIGFIEAERTSGGGYEVLAGADGMVALVRQAEDAARGFALTGDERFARSFEAARAQVDQRAELLRGAAAGDREQLERVARLEEAARRRTELARLEIAARRAGGLAAARASVRAGAAREDMDSAADAERALEEAGRRRLAERRARADAGSWRLIAIVAVGGGGAVLFVLLAGAVLGRDIAARERADEETAWLNARLRAILDSAKQVAIIVTDLGGTVTVFNSGAERMFGYAAAEVIGRLTPAAFLRAEGVESHARELSRRLGREVRPENSLFETARAGGEFEWTCWRKDGEPLVVAVTMTGLEHDGKLAGSLAIGRDVTAQRRAEAEAARSAERLRAVFDASTEVGIIVSDAEGVIRLFNVGAERLLGWTADEVVGKLKPVVFHEPAEVDARRAELALELGRQPTEPEVFAFGIVSGGIEDREWTYVRRDGSTLPVRVVLTGIRGEGGRLDGFLGVISDVREQRRAREEIGRARDLALRAAEAKSQFLANVSHEIRTPMNAILGMTGLLVDEAKDARQREQLETVRTAADALLALINDLLDFSKIEAGKMRLEEQDFDPREVVELAVELFASRARGKGLELSVAAGPDLPAAVRGDPGRLRQVLLNLVGNAVKFTERGSVRVGVAAAPDGLRFEIVDTGIGIPAESFARLFQSFSQVDGSTTRRYEGTGLGLAISRQLVELMRGRIGAESEPGRGSKFWFEVPLARGRAPARDEEPALPAPVAASRRLRVLVVEDNSVNQKVLLMLLRRLGHAAEAVAGGREALESLAGIRYDLILMDCQMPDMDGYETTRELRRREAPDGPRTPVVALTANVLPEDRQRCFEAGMDEFLAKPVRIEDLARVLADRLRAPLNPEAVERFRALVGEKAFAEVLLEFLRSARDLVGAIAEADRADDTEALKRAAHTLKGASGSIGADALEALCRRTEELCRRAEELEPGARAQRRELVARMRGELEAVRRSAA